MNERTEQTELAEIRRELGTIRSLLSEGIRYLRDAESEIPERIRRFSHHMHSIHDIKYMYEELGVVPPPHLLAELERVDDRFRQLIAEENAEGGTFSKVRREMASDPFNRFDHTRSLPKPTHEVKDARKSEVVVNGGDQAHDDSEGSTSGIRR